MVTPRLTPGGEAVGVRLIEAMRQRAVVMWCTHADTMPKQAAAVSVLALADLHDAAEQGDAPWTLLLDEFGAVIKMAAERGVAILQRGRSHHGQVIVITQSVADIEALSQLPGLLASLTDNFTAVIAHRQTSPEARDWLAKMMGTRGLWQHTNQTTSHGQAHSGQGSARRVREFRVGADVFATLADGEAVIYNVHGPDPARAAILPVALTDQEPERIGTSARHECERRSPRWRSSASKPHHPATATRVRCEARIRLGGARASGGGRRGRGAAARRAARRAPSRPRERCWASSVP